jgi:CHASE2 domain-containing sensor protein
MNIKMNLIKLRSKGFWYWFWVVLLVIGGTYVGDKLGKWDGWIDGRNSIYKFQTHRVRPEPYVQATEVVLIEDKDYWGGSLGRRSPIKRDYLAKLLRALDSADPKVIALDFDLRSPMPDGSMVEHPDYKLETEQLLQAIKEVSRHRVVVLPKTIGGGNGGIYELESDIYDGFDFGGGNIRKGYIALPYDIRQITPTLPLTTGESINSFALSIVRAYNDKALPLLRDNYAVRFSGFMLPDAFDQFSASDVLNSDPRVLSKLAHRIVIVGGSWRKFAYMRGDQVDAYPTPVGKIVGALIHANYVEALLGQQVYEPMSKWLAVSIEVFLTLIVAIIFALDIHLGWKVGGVLLLWGILLFCGYVFLQNLGLFFDFFVPSILVGLHAGFERIREWRTAFAKLREVHL